MKRNKKKKDEKPVKLFTLDTETRGLFGDVFRVGLYDGNRYWAANEFSHIQQILKQFTNDYECHIFIHNLDFDLSKLAKYLLPTAILDDSIFINNNVAVFTTTDIILHDSLKILPSSLENLCKDFGLEEKSKIDLTDHLLSNGYGLDNKGRAIKVRSQFNKSLSLENYFMNVDPWEAVLNEYLRFDCTSLYEILIQVMDISGLDIKDFINSPTTASLAMKVYKTQFNDDYEKVISSNYLGQWGSFIEDVIRQSYYGGRTEVFLPQLANGYHYDVNSLYPYVMKVNEFPIGYYDLYDGPKATQIYKVWKRSKKGAGFAWVKIHVPETMNIPPLPVRHEKKLIFPVGNLSGVWTFHEIEMAERYGCTIEKVEQIIFFKRTAPVFKKFVEKFETIKNTSTGAKRTFAKLCQNSLYGKFGMKRIRQSLFLYSEEKIKELDDKEKSYREFYHPYLKKKFIESETESKAEYIQPHIAAYVTSYARILLYESIMHQLEKREVVAYCDTDSMATSSQLHPDLVHDKEYGKWKLEAEIKEAIFLQPKLYYEQEFAFKKDKDTDEFILDKDGNKIHKETIKAKGIPKDILKTFNKGTYEDILKRIKNGEERIELFSNKKVRQKFATLLKNGKDFDTPIFIQKGLNLRAKQKRQMDYINNYSYPHALYHFGELPNRSVREIQDGKDYGYHEEQLKLIEKDIINEFNKSDLIKEKINLYGFIKIPNKSDLFYFEYNELPTFVHRLYFRKYGLPIDVWCMEADEEPSLLMDKIKGGILL